MQDHFHHGLREVQPRMSIVNEEKRYRSWLYRCCSSSTDSGSVLERKYSARGLTELPFDNDRPHLHLPDRSSHVHPNQATPFQAGRTVCSIRSVRKQILKSLSLRFENLSGDSACGPDAPRLANSHVIYRISLASSKLGLYGRWERCGTLLCPLGDTPLGLSLLSSTVHNCGKWTKSTTSPRLALIYRP